MRYGGMLAKKEEFSWRLKGLVSVSSCSDDGRMSVSLSGTLLSKLLRGLNV